jgi:hypothetical protein
VLVVEEGEKKLSKFLCIGRVEECKQKEEIFLGKNKELRSRNQCFKEKTPTNATTTP